jgi:hypothetical protein
MELDLELPRLTLDTNRYTGGAQDVLLSFVAAIVQRKSYKRWPFCPANNASIYIWPINLNLRKPCKLYLPERIM